MGLSEWLRLKGYDPEKGLCVTVGTDGLRVARDNIMSVSTAVPGGASETVYIDGADCDKVSAFTGLSCLEYDERKVGIERAIELLAPAVIEADFIITYCCKDFTRPWLIHNMPALFLKVEFLDITDIIHIGDIGGSLPMNVDYVDDLRERVSGALVGVRPYAFKKMCDRFIPEHVTGDLITLEDKPKMLAELYQRILLRG